MTSDCISSSSLSGSVITLSSGTCSSSLTLDPRATTWNASRRHALCSTRAYLGQPGLHPSSNLTWPRGPCAIASHCLILPHIASHCLTLPRIASDCLGLPRIASDVPGVRLRVHTLITSLIRSVPSAFWWDSHPVLFGTQRAINAAMAAMVVSLRATRSGRQFFAGGEYALAAFLIPW